MTHKTHHNTSAVYNIKVLPLHEITQQYGIEVAETGEVWDAIEFKNFKNLTEWAMYIDELNNDELYNNFSKIGHKQVFDDGC